MPHGHLEVKAQLVVDGARDAARTEIDPKESTNAAGEHGDWSLVAGDYATWRTLKTARAYRVKTSVWLRSCLRPAVVSW